MSERLGMNPTTARSVATSIDGLAEGLAFIQQEVQAARAMSLNPLSFMVNPGAMILAPASIGVAASAAADLANVRATLDYLVLKLRQEATQQEQVSNSLLETDPGWFAQAPTAQRPNDVTAGDLLWGEFGELVNLANWALLIEGIVTTGTEVVDFFSKNTPSWARPILDYADNAGKLVPFVGMPIAWAGVATDWDEDYVWGNTRNIIGASIATLEVIALIPPLTPAAPIVGAVGLVWDVFDTVWDVGDDLNWW